MSPASNEGISTVATALQSYKHTGLTINILLLLLQAYAELVSKIFGKVTPG